MVFDTNVVVYAARRDSEFHTPCRQRIAEVGAASSPAFLTWNVCYEFLRVITHPRIYPQPWSLYDGCRHLRMLLASPNFGLLLPTENHLDLLIQVATELPDIRGNMVHDLHTAVLAREHGISRICTLDGDFQRFPFIEVINPLLPLP